MYQKTVTLVILIVLMKGTQQATAVPILPRVRLSAPNASNRSRYVVCLPLCRNVFIGKVTVATMNHNHALKSEYSADRFQLSIKPGFSDCYIHVSICHFTISWQNEVEQLKARVRELEAAMRKKGKCELDVHKVIIERVKKQNTRGHGMDGVSIPNSLDSEQDIVTSGIIM